MSGIIDVNVWLERWPFRRLPGDASAAKLAERLKSEGVEQAWAGSFEGLFHRDVAGANARLAEAAAGDPGFWRAFGTVNPALPEWEEDLRRCREEHHMPGVRLTPNYHGYALDDPRFAKLLAAATERKLVVQIALSMEDERQQSPLARAAHVDATPLKKLLPTLPDLRVVLINAFRAITPIQAESLAAAGHVGFDIAMVEAVGGVANLVQKVGIERVLFGSHAPFFIWQSAALKLRESALGGLAERAITRENAERMLEGKAAR